MPLVSLIFPSRRARRKGFDVTLHNIVTDTQNLDQEHPFFTEDDFGTLPVEWQQCIADKRRDDEDYTVFEEAEERLARQVQGPVSLHDLELEDEHGFLLPPNEVPGFWDYVEEFIRYEKRTPIRVWTGSAWPVKTRKGKRASRPAVLYDDKITSNLAEYPQSIVLRHLQGRHVISTMPGRRSGLSRTNFLVRQGLP